MLERTLSVAVTRDTADSERVRQALLQAERLEQELGSRAVATYFDEPGRTGAGGANLTANFQPIGEALSASSVSLALG